MFSLLFKYFECSSSTRNIFFFSLYRTRLIFLNSALLGFGHTHGHDNRCVTLSYCLTVQAPALNLNRAYAHGMVRAFTFQNFDFDFNLACEMKIRTHAHAYAFGQGAPTCMYMMKTNMYNRTASILLYSRSGLVSDLEIMAAWLPS